MVLFADASGGSNRAGVGVTFLNETGLFSGQDFLVLALSSICHRTGLAEVELGLKILIGGAGAGSFGVVFAWFCFTEMLLLGFLLSLKSLLLVV